MDPKRWRQIEQLYHAVLEREPSRRIQFLVEACQSDQQLRNEVESLLAHGDSSPEALINRPAWLAVTELPGDLTATLPGRVVSLEFAPGTVMAQRYRIVNLLGHGGMGEVYRADDLVLGQPVALKFLPAASSDPEALARFRNEARMARQVTHPNVCRVYDIGEAEGLTYLTMEYVDGEDLASLLRRIGKLPEDKALEVARQLCAGLAAAHDKGVIHRDLKPANIMLDGRGQVRITDFSIAGLAEQIRDFRSGTPDYMSPEQLAGKEVTTRSDIYSLGIVLCELLTGKRPPLKPAAPGSMELDPAVERVIQRCLEPDPRIRPGSALAVSAALPGGDPLAAALARGDTPSPDVVAASEHKEGLTPRTAAVGFTTVLLLLAVFAVLFERGTIVHFAPPEIPTEALAFRAQQVLNELGYREIAKSSAYGFDQCDWSYLGYLDQHGDLNRAKLLATQRPAVISFWYRQSREAFRPNSSPTIISIGDAIDYNSPANSDPGMVRLRLDAKGRLIALEARPLENYAPGAFTKASPTVPTNWSVLFRFAELDPARFSPAEPLTVPPSAFDARTAWTGTFSEGRPEQVRVEAAWWGGQPVYFTITGDWQKLASLADPHSRLFGLALAALFVLVVVGSALLAVRNVRRGRADRKGAWLTAVIGFCLILSSSLLTSTHVASLWELAILLKALSWSGGVAVLLSMLYLAIEPYVRRNWPDALISWARFRAGWIRDPLVASHLLIGILAIMAWEVLFWVVFAAGSTAIRTWQPFPALLQSLNGPGRFVAVLLFQMSTGLFVFIAFLLVVVLVRLLLRRLWLADLLSSMLISCGAFVSFSNPVQGAIAGILNIGFIYTMLWVLRRFGLIAVLTAVIADQVLTMTGPIQLSSWYAGRSLLTLALPAAVAAWALWVIAVAHRIQPRRIGEDR